MSKLLLFLSFFTYGVATNAQSVSSDRFATVDDVAGHRVILYDVGQMKSMKHIPIHMMNEKGKLKVVKDTLELSGLKDGMRFDEPAAIEQVKKDTYVKLVKDGIAYYFLVDEKDNPYIPSALRNYDYWTEMLALFREKYEYKEMVFKNSSMYNEGEQAGKYAEVTWTKINIPSSKEGQVTFSYEVEGSTDSLDPLSVDENVFLTEAAVNTAKQVYENGQKKLEEYKIQYEYVDVNKSKDFRYKGADVLVGQYLPLTWTAVFLPQGLHDAVRYRVSGGLSVNDYSESEISGMSGILMSTDDVIRKEIGEEWVDVAYKETDDESDNAQTAESVKAIHVDGFELDESDLTAMQQGTSVQDKDGNRCALIKIETKESDLTFDVGTQGIVKTEHKTGEEWLYVPSGIRAIQISHPQYGSYQYVIPRKVEKGRTYNMQLSFDKKTEARRKGEITQGLKDAMKRYDRVYGFHNGLAPVIRQNKFGFIDINGNEIIPCNYNYVHYYDSISILAAGIYGSALAYDESLPCEDTSSWLFVADDVNKGIIDTSGNIIIPLKFGYGDSQGGEPTHFCFSEGLARVTTVSNKWGFIDKAGKIVIPCKYGEVGEFSEGLAYYNYGRAFNGEVSQYGFIDKNGREVIKFNGEGCCGDFNNGTAVIMLNDGRGIIDRTGKEIIKISTDYCYSDYSDGLYLVRNNNTCKLGIINNKGKEIRACEYDDICYYSGHIEPAFYDLNEFDYEYDKDRKYAIVVKDDKYGFLDMSGNTIIPCNNDIYDDSDSNHETINFKLHNFIGGELFVSINGKHGLKSLTGIEIVPPIYDDVDLCGEGLYVVKQNNKYGCVNKSGKIIIPIIYDDIKHSSEGLIGVGKYTGESHNGINEIKYGFVNRLGKLIIPCTYGNVGEFHCGLAKVYDVVNGHSLYGFINTEGIQVSEIKYSSFEEDGIIDYYDYYSDAESSYGFWVVQKGYDYGEMEYGYMDRYGNDTFEE